MIKHQYSYSRRLMILLIGVTSLSVGAEDAWSSPSFQGLGDLSGGVFDSSATSVSPDGLVVVGSSNSASGTEAFRWTSSGGMVGLGDLPGGDFSSEALAVSAGGSVIVGRSRSASSGFSYEAFRWTLGGGMVGLGDLPGGGFSSSANAVSADGSVVVGTGFSASDSEAFRWTPGGGMVGLGFPPFEPHGDPGFSHGLGVSADGSVVVGVGNDPASNSSEAYRWTQATGMVTLGGLPSSAHSPSSGASAVSADGSVVVGESTSDTGGPPTTEAFRWTQSDGMVGLGSILDMTYGAGGEATAVSADGSVVVGISRIKAGDQAVLWTADDGIRLLRDVLTDDVGLDLTGWTLESATGISDDGLTIVGWGTNPNGDTEAFIATLPEPGTLVVIVLGIPALLRRRR